MSDLKPGDIVELKSGGPKMTVDRIDGSIAYCCWFIESRHHSGYFSLAALDASSKAEAPNVD